MGLKTSLAPDLRDMRLGGSQFSGQTAGAPLGGFPAGFAVQSPVDDPCFELLAARSGLTAPMPAVESSESILAETLPPQTHGIDPAALAGADRPQRKPTTEIENDAALRPSSLRALRLLAIFISSRRSGGLITKGAAMLSSIASCISTQELTALVFMPEVVDKHR